MPAIPSRGSAIINAPGRDAVRCDITAISFSGLSTSDIDCTDITSTDKAYIQGTLDGGTVEFTGHVETWTSGDPDIIGKPVAGDNVATYFNIRLGASPSAAGAEVPLIQFYGYVQSVALEAGVDASVSVTYTVRISGAVTVTSTTTGGGIP